VLSLARETAVERQKGGPDMKDIQTNHNEANLNEKGVKLKTKQIEQAKR